MKKKHIQFRRLSAVFVAIFLSVCMVIPTHAAALDESGISNADLYNFLVDIWNKLANDVEYNIKYNQNASKQDIDDVKNSMAAESEKGIGNYFDSKVVSNPSEKTNFSKEDNAVFSITNMLFDVANSQWKNVGEAMKTGINSGGDELMSDTDITLNPKYFVNTKNDMLIIIRTFAYSLVLVFFAVSLIENSIKYEIFTLRGGANVFGRLILSKILIDTSATICIYILDAITGVAQQILSAGDLTLESSLPNLTEKIPGSDIWLLGPLIDVLISLLILLPVILIGLVTLISACMVMVKLTLRSIELCLMVIVSPAFFACASSDVTKPYFKSFITTFLQVALQLLFMAIVYGLCTLWTTSTTQFTDGMSVFAWFAQILPNTLIMLAMAIIMVKPPRVLTSLVR